MESTSKADLISTVNTQSEQLKRYEDRLRDMVAAYKRLKKEKNALENSLGALTKSKEASNNDADEGTVAALTESLATLTAEKKSLEETFQADKKSTREKYESILGTLKEEIRKIEQEKHTEVTQLKAKIGFEMQEREKDHADHAAMIKELHLKLITERKTKEELEDKFVIASDSQVSNPELEKRVRDLNSELEAAQRKLKRAEARAGETPENLLRLQEKMQLLQQSHSVAIREEQIKAKRAEETARKICASQEERVALLEAKIAELSQTIGEYDLQRRKDQSLIQQLRDNMNKQILEKTSSDVTSNYETQQKSETDNEKLADTEYLQNLIDKIHILKLELIAENDKLGNPVDVHSIFSTNTHNVHEVCQEELERVKSEFDMFKSQLSQNNPVQLMTESLKAKEEISELKSHVSVLQSTIKELNIILDVEKRDKIKKLKQEDEKLQQEQNYHKEVTSELKGRIVSLEKQLQTQRDRYSALLEETDHYIRSRTDRSRKVSMEEGFKEGPSLQEMSGPPHLLHYVQELSRKDLDISQLRKDKHSLEGQLRDCQREMTIEKERFKEVLRTLKAEIDRLLRSQSREGANLEYLKNVVLSYLLSSDYAGRRHMLNAIAAVLHFTDKEKNTVLAILR